MEYALLYKALFLFYFSQDGARHVELSRIEVENKHACGHLRGESGMNYER
jgi:hypothetical protein